ncbi:MAG: hypothetical protein L6V81_05180 [Clostridium sp.]|nr:MAG: hypothetical protein L6V81_05180 [Clostridium sp.]
MEVFLEYGTPDEILNSKNPIVREFLGKIGKYFFKKMFTFFNLLVIIVVESI